MPIIRTRGSVSRPPVTDPRISPAANRGKSRFARRVSVTTPAMPQTKTFCNKIAIATVSQRTGRIHRPPPSSATRSARTTAPSPAGIARYARRRSTCPRTAASPSMNTNAVPPCTRYMSGRASVPIRSKKSAFAALWPIARPAMPTNDNATIGTTSRVSPWRILSVRWIALIARARRIGSVRAAAFSPDQRAGSPSAGRPTGSTSASTG